MNEKERKIKIVIKKIDRQIDKKIDKWPARMIPNIEVDSLK